MRSEADGGDDVGMELHDTAQVKAWPVDASHSGKSSSLCRCQFEKIPVSEDTSFRRYQFQKIPV